MEEVRKVFTTFIASYKEINLAIVEEILERLQKSYSGKIHRSGDLLYVRAIHIAQLVAEQMKEQPTIFKNTSDVIEDTPTEIICGALLYDLSCYTSISLMFIRANYNANIYFLVRNILSIDQIKARNIYVPYVKKRYDNLISQRQPCAIYIKLAERLYDLEHATGYANKSEVLAMARETLSVDVYMAKEHFAKTDIATKLKATAKAALEMARVALNVQIIRRRPQPG
jgi:(p)ppGpp synthase/HD superfamily hydrolase